jgi:NADH dehydrogenase [ubiquinone] 1 alpha subcomplex assembly factor 7
MQSTPERLDHFMARANAIYYASRDPFADFTTSPEISQVFGEIIGLWAVIAWQLLGSPAPICLIEAGPGRGTLMADALRAIRRAAPDFAAALQVHLIETSPRLRAAQQARIPDAIWHASLASVPEAPCILIANEFLDALPIRQFVRRGAGWAERYVADGQWQEHATNFADPRTAGEGEIVEINEPARGFIVDTADRLARNPGAALFLDYGPAQSGVGDSLQALANKQPVDPLSLAGAADLTAHVDFADLASVANAHGAHVQGPEAQGRFLLALGLAQRTERLCQTQPERAQDIRQATRRLVDPTAMGSLFKVLALRSQGCPPLPGLPD